MFSWEHHVFTLKSHYNTDLWVHSDINVISGVTSNFGPPQDLKNGPPIPHLALWRRGLNSGSVPWFTNVFMEMEELHLTSSRWCCQSPIHQHCDVCDLQQGETWSSPDPSTKIVRFGPRSFNVSGPTVWNSLPVNIRNCKSFETFGKQLKAFLYLRADSC